MFLFFLIANENTISSSLSSSSTVNNVDFSSITSLDNFKSKTQSPQEDTSSKIAKQHLSSSTIKQENQRDSKLKNDRQTLFCGVAIKNEVSQILKFILIKNDLFINKKKNFYIKSQ